LERPWPRGRKCVARAKLADDLAKSFPLDTVVKFNYLRLAAPNLHSAATILGAIEALKMLSV
jgi:hypothetical protein